MSARTNRMRDLAIVAIELLVAVGTVAAALVVLLR